MFVPRPSDTASTPTASDEVEMSAMAESPFSRPLPFKRSSRMAASTTTGSATPSGARFAAEATASAPKPICDRPSPIIE